MFEKMTKDQKENTIEKTGRIMEETAFIGSNYLTNDLGRQFDNQFEDDR
tara:strand:+ start:466 stop:612 length:147 start_codon:yes stop_codon:yes gene_type:complete